MESLKSILEKYQVEIPIIQRDYAQGRKIPRVNRIREKFVEDLLDVLKNEDSNCQLHLDFIYGKEVDSNRISQIKANQDSVQEFLNAAWNHSRLLDVDIEGEMPKVRRITDNENITKVFPLDGQQRLTTLWLLYFIVFHQNNDMPKWLTRFTYNTRKSSRDFISALVENHQSFQVISNYSNPIKNSNWFLKKWEFDPTVQGMLVTLDEIFRQCVKENVSFSKLKNNLVNENRITFEFLPLSSLNLDNGIYVKMNARGKELSEFENFKNSLLSFLKEEYKKDDVRLFANKLDLYWHDIFWNYKGLELFDVQKQFYDFIKADLLNNHLSKVDPKNINNELVRTILNLEKNESKRVYLDFRALKENNLIQKEYLNGAFCLLDILSNSELVKTYEEWFTEIAFNNINGVTNKTNQEYSLVTISLSSKSDNIIFYDRSMIYAITEFIKKTKSCDLSYKPNFLRYIRICQNLIYNQVYIQDIETYSSGLKAVKELAENSDNLYDYMLSNTTSSILRNRTQFAEERIKLLIIQQNQKFEELFIDAEKHSFFRGQIGFLITRSGGSEDFDSNQFKKIYAQVECLFKDIVLQNSDYLLERALLTYGNYWNDQKRSKWQFFQKSTALRPKEEGWRQLFRDEKRLDKLLKLSEKIRNDNVEVDLQNVIDSYSQNNWRYYFIKSAEPWKKCYERYVKIAFEGKPEEKVRLLEKVLANSKQRELRTYFHYKELNLLVDPFQKIDYNTTSDQNDNPCFYLDNWWYGEKRYFLDVRYSEEKYEFRFGVRSDKVENLEVDDEISEFLVENDYQLNQSQYQDNSYIKNVKSDKAFETELSNLLVRIKNLETSIPV